MYLKWSTGPPSLRVATVAGVLLGLTGCADQSEPLSPEPSWEISDAAHLDGNEDFFFLPPLVPDPSTHPAFNEDGFDPSQEPEVVISVVEGLECPVSATDGFPVTFTMSTGPGSETVRLSEADEHYSVNWHTDQFTLAAECYRITVQVGGMPLGHADVQVVSNGSGFKNVDTDAYVPLKDGRTLPIKFRIEEGAVMQPVVIAIHEVIAVRDAVSLLPPVVIEVAERIAVADAVEVFPPVLIALDEVITVVDEVRVLPPVRIEVTEIVVVGDDVSVTKGL